MIILHPILCIPRAIDDGELDGEAVVIDVVIDLGDLGCAPAQRFPSTDAGRRVEEMIRYIWPEQCARKGGFSQAGLSDKHYSEVDAGALPLGVELRREMEAIARAIRHCVAGPPLLAVGSK